MNSSKPLRVMWLLNHTTARKFEVEMLKAVGVKEIFLPKSYPQSHSFRTASVDYSQDEHLTIPGEVLDILNETDWYSAVSEEIWGLASEYFDIAFMMFLNKGALEAVSKYFQGAVVWRVYGRDRSANYDYVLNKIIAPSECGGFCVRRLGRRFYFGEAYPDISKIEPPYLSDRKVYLPLGLSDASLNDRWEGADKRIYFVCPEIASSPLYSEIYRAFKRDFCGLPYVVAGAQPIAVKDPAVLGFVSNEKHAYNMSQLRVMFYHSEEPNHIHYHPFEAIRAGMPLVFMGGGMLDKMGGRILPGRCSSVAVARKKIERILADDWDLIREIRSSQPSLLDPMRPKLCEPAWREGIEQILSELQELRKAQVSRPMRGKCKRIAVIVPSHCTIEGVIKALSIAEALYSGSRESGETADVVLATQCSDDVLSEDIVVADRIKHRPFSWSEVSADRARRAMRYAGYQSWEPALDRYIVPDDGIMQLLDCDLWFLTSENLSCPLLPLRPTVLMVDGLYKRYGGALNTSDHLAFGSLARSADRVLVPTESAHEAMLQHLGVDPRRVSRVPLLPPDYSILRSITFKRNVALSHFVLVIGVLSDADRRRMTEALRAYFFEFDGKLDCKVVGTETRFTIGTKIVRSESLEEMEAVLEPFGKRVEFVDDQSATRYWDVLAASCFLWYPDRTDIGRLRLLEAASLGVPSLAIRTSAMKEVDIGLSLGLTWVTDSDSPSDVGRQMKCLEREASLGREPPTSEEKLRPVFASGSVKGYWEEVRRCL